MSTKFEVSPAEAANLLWNEGNLEWLLHRAQKELHNSYTECKEKIIVWNCSRRLGKSFSLCVIALEKCLQKPNSLVKYCCDKQVNAKNIIRPLIRDIIASCPPELRPSFKTQERAWVFPNGSRIELSGLDGGKAESIRGGSADLAIIDEAGLVDDLQYIINSILLPTTTTTKGKIILASTPPKSATHDFVKIYMNTARIQGNLITKTIYDNPLIDADELQKIIDCYVGGKDSIEFRREFKCEVLTDANSQIVPEFTPTLREEIVREWDRVPFYDGYVAMDLGIKDLTVVLFAWYDFLAGKIIIEDEFVMNGQKMTTKGLAEGILLKENQIYTDKMTGESRLPFLRVSDTNLHVINDLWHLHRIRFIPARKDDKLGGINNMRIMLQNKQIIINPRCKTVISHLESGVWNKAKTSFDRSGDFGHFDALDALVYLCRIVNLQKNPYPASASKGPDTWNYNNSYKKNPEHQVFRDMFRVNKPSTPEKVGQLQTLKPKKD